MCKSFSHVKCLCCATAVHFATALSVLSHDVESAIHDADGCKTIALKVPIRRSPIAETSRITNTRVLRLKSVQCSSFQSRRDVVRKLHFSLLVPKRTAYCMRTKSIAYAVLFVTLYGVLEIDEEVLERLTTASLCFDVAKKVPHSSVMRSLPSLISAK